MRQFWPFKAKIWPFLAKIDSFESFSPITSNLRYESSYFLYGSCSYSFLWKSHVLDAWTILKCQNLAPIISFSLYLSKMVADLSSFSTSLNLTLSGEPEPYCVLFFNKAHAPNKVSLDNFSSHNKQFCQFSLKIGLKSPVFSKNWTTTIENLPINFFDLVPLKSCFNVLESQ